MQQTHKVLYIYWTEDLNEITQDFPNVNVCIWIVVPVDSFNDQSIVPLLICFTSVERGGGVTSLKLFFSHENRLQLKKEIEA